MMQDMIYLFCWIGTIYYLFFWKIEKKDVAVNMKITQMK